MNAHTPTPYAIEEFGGRFEMTNEETGFTVAIITKFGSEKLAKANAEFIVRACNAHDELVAALQDAVAFIGYDGVDCTDIKDAAYAALAKAGAA